MTKRLNKNLIKDHVLQFLLEPLISIESTFKYLTVRRNLSQMDVLGLIRKRIGFFGVCNLFDRVEMKYAQSEATTQIQNRHAFRLKQLTNTMNDVYQKLDEVNRKLDK